MKALFAGALSLLFASIAVAEEASGPKWTPVAGVVVQANVTPAAGCFDGQNFYSIGTLKTQEGYKMKCVAPTGDDKTATWQLQTSL